MIVDSYVAELQYSWGLKAEGLVIGALCAQHSAYILDGEVWVLIWIIGGTSEAVELVHKIRGKKAYIVSVATYSGKEALGDEHVLVARLTTEEMEDFIRNNGIGLVVDMSHPYAVEVTQNAKEASAVCNVPYIRYVRERAVAEDTAYFKSWEVLLHFLQTVKGCVFFTTGIKGIKDFEKVRGDNRFVYRVLPTLFSIEECVKHQVKMEDIVAVLGPVSKSLNMAMFKECDAQYVVMKDSGEKGGTPEKLEACKELGITPLVVGREDEEGIGDLDALVEKVDDFGLT